MAMKANMAVIPQSVHRCLSEISEHVHTETKGKGIIPCGYASEKAALDALPFVDTVARNGT